MERRDAAAALFPGSAALSAVAAAACWPTCRDSIQSAPPRAVRGPRPLGACRRGVRCQCGRQCLGIRHVL